MQTDIKNTWEGILLVEYRHANPNGDMNAGGAPKIDPIDGCALVSGESLRRKLRDYVLEEHSCQAPYDVLIRSGSSLEREDGGDLTIDDMVQVSRQDAGLGLSPEYQKKRNGAKKSAKKGVKDKKTSGAKKKKEELSRPDQRKVLTALCSRFWDARTFGFLGGVGSDKIDSAKGPLVIQTGISLHPVVDLHEANTRRMVTHEGEKEKRNRTVGNRTVLRYALVQHKFTLTPASARVTGMTEKDFFLAVEAMVSCWALTGAPHRRAVLRGIWLFKQPLRGRRPVPYDWDDVVKTRCKLDDPIEASSFDDFETVINSDLIPPGVEVLDLDAVLKLIGFDEDQAA